MVFNRPLVSEVMDIATFTETCKVMRDEFHGCDYEDCYLMGCDPV
jgi:hypothetical protein